MPGALTFLCAGKWEHCNLTYGYQNTPNKVACRHQPQTLRISGLPHNGMKNSPLPIFKGHLTNATSEEASLLEAL